MRDDTSDLNSIIEHNFMNIGTERKYQSLIYSHDKKIINFKGHIEFDKKLDGSPRRALDSSNSDHLDGNQILI